MLQNSGSVMQALWQRVQIWPGQLWHPDSLDNFGEDGCGEMLSLHHPNEVLARQRAILQAGCDAVSTNTLGALPSVMLQNNVPGQDVEGLAFEANFESARVARRAAEEFRGATIAPLVLGSIGPTLHALTVMGGGEDKYTSTVAEYLRQAHALCAGGVDLLHLERCQDLRNVAAALAAVEQVRNDLDAEVPLIVTVEMLKTGTLLCGGTIADLVALVTPYAPTALGLTGRYLEEWRHLVKLTEVPVALLPDVFAVASKEQWFETPASIASNVALMMNEKVRVIGIGLGASPAYIEALVPLARRSA